MQSVSILILGIVLFAFAAFLFERSGIVEDMIEGIERSQNDTGEYSEDTSPATETPTENDQSDITDAIIAAGVVRAAFFEDRYSLRGSFEGLPLLSEDEFYEGWIVRKSPYERISTGVVLFENGRHVATFGSGRDLTQHDQFILTRERRDGGPEPGKEILRTEIKILKNEHAF